jgi:hypothetical protein
MTENEVKMKKKDEFQNNHLKHLFDMELQYSQGAVECAPIGLKEGRIIGGGDGFVEGSGIKGTVLWSNYENTVREGLCKVQIPGTIQTDDNEEILFEARGMAINQDRSRSSKWNFAGVFHFETGSKKYEWLNSVLAVYHGELSMETGNGRCRAYVKPWTER